MLLPVVVMSSSNGLSVHGRYGNGVNPLSVCLTMAANDGFDKNDHGVRTIADVARIAGVSPGTVSRALAGKSIVNRETRDRITAIAEAHGFRPNQMASRLRRQRSGMIGVVVPLGHERRQHLSDPFFMTLFGHIADLVTDFGHDIVLSRVIPESEDWLQHIATSGMLDGVLLIGQSDQYVAIERVARDYRPLVVWGSLWPDQTHCSVGTDNLAGGRLAGEHLIARGARRIAFLGDIRAPEIRQRHDGVATAMAAAGLGPPLQLDAHLASDIMEQEIAAQIVRIADEVDGIAAASDVLAMSALRVLADHGIDVPGQVRVVGYDGLPLAMQTVPRLTTIRQDIAGGAQAMVQALFARIAGEDVRSIEMPPELIERGST